MRVIFTIDSD